MIRKIQVGKLEKYLKDQKPSKTKRDVINQKLVNKAGHTYIDFFRVFPEYKGLLNRIQEVLDEVRSSFTTKCHQTTPKCLNCPVLPCCDIVDHNLVYAQPSISPYFNLFPMIDMSIIFKGKGIHKVTIQDVFAGRAPFAYIIHVLKYKLESFINRHDEHRQLTPNMFVTFCFNPLLFLDNINIIQNQLDTNIYNHREIATWQKWIFYYLYVKQVLGYLDSYDVLAIPEKASSDCCCHCENANSIICKFCKLTQGNYKQTYAEKNPIMFPNVYSWNNTGKDLTLDIKFVTMKEDKAIRHQDNAMNIHIEEISRYGLYFDNQKRASSTEFSFYIPFTKKVVKLANEIPKPHPKAILATHINKQKM